MTGQRTRYNAKGRRIPSNHGVTGDPSLLTCDGCGREFNAYRLAGDLAPRGGTEWRRNNLNRARAVSHADRCKT